MFINACGVVLVLYLLRSTLQQQLISKKHPLEIFKAIVYEHLKEA